MKKRKKSLFEKITGTVKLDDFDEDYLDEDEDVFAPPSRSKKRKLVATGSSDLPELEEHEEDAFENMGQLSVDVINQPDEIIIRAIVAGVKPHELDVQISRDSVTIQGTREENIEVDERDYYHRELYWGGFARNILLPEEIDVELANAQEKHGLLELHLPKIDQHRKTRLQIKSN